MWSLVIFCIAAARVHNTHTEGIGIIHYKAVSTVHMASHISRVCQSFDIHYVWEYGVAMAKWPLSYIHMWILTQMNDVIMEDFSRYVPIFRMKGRQKNKEQNARTNWSKMYLSILIVRVEIQYNNEGKASSSNIFMLWLREKKINIL